MNAALNAQLFLRAFKLCARVNALHADCVNKYGMRVARMRAREEVFVFFT